MAVLPALLLLLADSTAPQGPLSSADLVALCNARSRDSANACTVYLRGAFEGLISAETSLADGDPTFCLPDDGVSLSEIRSTFVHYVAADPEQADMGASAVLLASLEDNYPCLDDQDGDAAPQIASTIVRDTRRIQAARIARVQPARIAPALQRVSTLHVSYTQPAKTQSRSRRRDAHRVSAMALAAKS
jgi:hypothetical protein